jgi:hypothetical protein
MLKLISEKTSEADWNVLNKRRDAENAEIRKGWKKLTLCLKRNFIRYRAKSCKNITDYLCVTLRSLRLCVKNSWRQDKYIPKSV